jgi:MFS family permease
VQPILDAFRGVLANRDLRRVELALVCFSAVEYGSWIALLVYAFERGGTTEASLVAVLMLVPAALVAAPAAVLADRHPPARVLAATYLLQAVGAAGVAAAIWVDAPLGVVIAASVVVGLAMTLPRPTQAALIPFLARSANELTATNVVSSWAENGSALVATFGAGVLLDVSGAAAVFAASAVLMTIAAVLAAGVNGPQPAPGGESDGALDDLLAGVRVLKERPEPRLLMWLLAVELTIFGALDLLCVVLAIDVLELGGGWAGYLNAAFAAGGAIGSVSAVLLVGRRRLSPVIGVAMLAWGLSFVVIAVWPSAAVAVALLIVGGTGRSVFDVGSRTLLQRTTPTDVLARVFGLLEGIELGGLAVGAVLVPVLVSLGGATAALVGVGGVLMLAVLLAARRLATVDRRATVPVVQISLLRSMRLFRLLPAPALESLAGALEPVRAPAGTDVVVQGAAGDRFYAIASGEVDVVADGVRVATLGRSDGFGEIALLDDVPRTATVTARSDVELYALERGPFVTAITGHAPSAQEASDLVARRRQELAALITS